MREPGSPDGLRLNANDLQTQGKGQSLNFLTVKAVGAHPVVIAQDNGCGTVALYQHLTEVFAGRHTAEFTGKIENLYPVNAQGEQPLLLFGQ